MDGSYNEIFKLYSVISLKDMFFKFETKFNIISTKLETSDPSELIKEIKLLTRELSKIPDNRNIISSLNKSVRNLKKKKVDYVKIKKDFETAYMLYVQKSNDLKVIDNRVVSELDNYLKTVSTSIGVGLLIKTLLCSFN